MFKNIWIPHPTQVYELAKVVEEDESTGMVTVESVDDGSVRQVQLSTTHIADPSHFIDHEDLCHMNNFHEAPLLRVLQNRLSAGNIYSNTGDVLISVNPYKSINFLYDNPLEYLDLPEDGDDFENAHNSRSTSKYPPHVYVTSNNALRRMILASDLDDPNSSVPKIMKLNQSVIVSGESGAGKTEASKHILNYLIAANNHTSNTVDLIDSSIKSISVEIKRVLLDSNVIFEAFGNAKTVRNDNSSRFGKYIMLQYTSDNQLMSARTETFLLEKSRLVSVGQNERNYHAFYQLIRGLQVSDPDVARRLRLENLDAFAMLTAGQCTVISSEQTDVEDFTQLHGALQSLGCTDELLSRLWEVLACILHLGNIDVTPADDTQQPAILTIPTIPVEQLADLLGVSQEILAFSITVQRIAAGSRGSVHHKILSPEDARNNCFALMKWLYNLVFTWVVKRINLSHSKVAESDRRKVVKFIGILDIFGFEILQTNSFEQLCINYTNERLQQQFNEHVFVLEQEEYAREGLDWASITYRDNQHVIDLISRKPTGLLLILEEHGLLNRAPDDGKLVQAYSQTHEKVNDAFGKARFGNETFLVKHFAGEVSYAIAGFLVKNNDSLQEDLLQVMRSSTNTFLCRDLGAVEEEVEVPRRNQSKMAASVTVSYQFRNQLDVLMRTLRETEPHYIKCIKPNNNKRPDEFDAPLVVQQLRYSGALEIVRIRREGYPIRVPFADFCSEYRVLAHARGWLSPTEAPFEQSKLYASILAQENMIEGSYQIGNNFVFMRDGGLLRMHEAVKAFLTPFATRVQARYRTYRAGARYATCRSAAVRLQAQARRLVSRNRYRHELRLKIEREEREAQLAREAIERAEREAELERQRQEAERLRLEEEMAERRRKEAEEAAKREEERRLKLEEDERLKAEAEEQNRFEAAEKEEARQRELMERQAAEDEEIARVARASAEAISSKRIGRAVKAHARNRRLRRRLLELHEACRNGGVAVATKYVKSLPEYLQIRDHKANFASALSVAVRAGQAQIVALLSPRVTALSLERWEKAEPFHLACSGPSVSITTIAALGAQIDSYGKRKVVDEDAPMAAAASLQVLRAQRFLSLRLHEGWLSKRKEGKQWKRRFCVLTENELLYYASVEDALPKGVIAIKDCKIINTKFGKKGFEIQLAPEKATTKRKLFGSATKTVAMQFMGETDADTNSWLFVLRAIVGCIQSLGKRSMGDVHYIDFVSRKKVLSRSGFEGDTALHTLVRSATIADDVERKVDLLVAAHWLVAHGCPHDALTSDGNTALTLAIAAGITGLIEFLTALTEGNFPNTPLLPPQPQLHGYSFGSFTFEKHSFAVDVRNDASFMSLQNLRISIAVTDSKTREVLEVAQTTAPPFFARPRYLWWGQTWHLQTPLENLDGPCVVKMTLIHDAGELGNTTFEVDKCRIDCERKRVMFFATGNDSVLEGEFQITKKLVQATLL